MPVPIAVAVAGSRIVSAVKGAAQGYRAISGPPRHTVGERIGFGIGALLVLGICIAKDLADFVFAFMMGGAITGIMIPVAIAAWGLQVIMASFTWFCIHMYFFAISGGMPGHKKMTAMFYRLLLSGLFTIIGVIPGVSTFIPEATLGFVAMIMMENVMRGFSVFGNVVLGKR